MSVILALKVISKLAVSAFIYVLYTCLHVHRSRIVKKTPPNDNICAKLVGNSIGSWNCW